MAQVVKVFGRAKALELRKYFKAIGSGAFGSDSLRKVFQREVFVPYGGILLKNAQAEAGKISRSGQLAKSLSITGGATGRNGIGLAVRGEAAKYAVIINKGGWIYPKNHKYLAIPVGDNIDPKTGDKLKSMWDLPDDRTFTITPKGGPMAGRKFTFLKEFSDRAGSNPPKVTSPKTGKLINAVPKVKAMFELKEKHYVKPTYWARNAYLQSQKDLGKLVQTVARKYYSARGYGKLRF